MRAPILLLLTLFAASNASAELRLGALKFDNSGKPEAQAAFLRGLGWLHNFAYPQARREFVEAQKADPAFALAYWGEAMTENQPIWQTQDLDAGRAVIRKLPKAPTPREQMYLDAVRLLFAEGEKDARDAAYEQAMERLARTYPDDVEAKVFHALSILGLRKRDEADYRKQIRAAAILEPVAAAHPDHPGVLHYLIHAYDDPVLAPLGMRAANRYSVVAADAVHALHMPSHIYMQLGMWPEAAASNERAWATSKAWIESGVAKIRDYHSLSWLQYVYHQQGRHEEAKKLLDEPADVAREKGAKAEMRVRYAVETGDWNAFDFGAPVAVPAALSEGGGHCAAPTMTAYTGSEAGPLLFGQAMQALARKQVDHAARVVTQLAELRKTKTTTFDARVVEVMEREIEGLVELARGNTEKGLASLAAAAKLEDVLGPPFGPPDTVKPAHELYAEKLLELGRAAEAAEHFRASLQRTPNRAISLAGTRKAELAPRSARLHAD
jgi:tetratricopeptide (TPR) repeat protein